MDDAYRAVAELRSRLRRFQAETDRIAAQHHLTLAQYELLIIVRGFAVGRTGVTMGELAAGLALSRQSVTELVARAEDAGLLLRANDPGDGRVVRVRLTQVGRRRLDQVFAALSHERGRWATYLASNDR